MAITISGGSGTNTISGQASGVSIDSTGALNLPAGTTAQRPATPVVGMTRWNTTTTAYEVYTGGSSEWVSLATQVNAIPIEYLVVAGAAGGGAAGGGGGAGGFRTATGYSGNVGSTITVTVGPTFSLAAPAGVAAARRLLEPMELAVIPEQVVEQVVLVQHLLFLDLL